jgi:hypothetical protein
MNQLLTGMYAFLALGLVLLGIPTAAQTTVKANAVMPFDAKDFSLMPKTSLALSATTLQL